MNTTSRNVLPCLLLAVSGLWLHAASPITAFTYQGRLFDGGVPANGLYDLQFTNYDAAAAGNALGECNTNAVPVTNGLFTLTLDFGAVFDGTPRWLEISERTNGAAAFATLAPRQLLAAAPYATYAASAGTAGKVPGLTIVQNTNGAPSVVIGSGANYVASGVAGAVISGGGATNYYGFYYSNSVAADFGTVSGGDQNTVSAGGAGATIGGGEFNTASAGHATVAGGYENTASGAFAAMGGGDYNAAWSYATAVGGGEHNTASDAYATVGGGRHNVSGAVSATIAGGATNTASGDYATVDGGSGNTAGGVWATVGGGETNTASGEWATVAGGSGNTIQTGAGNTAIGGGFQNTIQANASGATISGGNYNTIQPEAYIATIGGGNRNLIQANAQLATIGGGPYNTIGSNAQYAVISGGAGNSVQAGGFGASIGGGGSNTVSAYYGTVPGGFLNSATTFAFAAGNQAQAIHTGAFVWADSTPTNFASTAKDQFAVRATGGAQFVTGGAGLTVDGAPVLTSASALLGLTIRQNANGAPDLIAGSPWNFVAGGVVGATIGGGGATNYLGYLYTNSVSADFGTVGGGAANIIQTGGWAATIGGGETNTIQTGAFHSTIGGGAYNTIQSGAFNATIGGGGGNTIDATNQAATISGGEINTIEADSFGATIGAGYWNTIQANAQQSTISGGGGNTIQANGQYATIPGGWGNSATTFAFAAGNQAQAVHTGAFVWADSTAADFSSTADNQFSVRARGGVFFQLDEENVTIQSDDISLWPDPKQFVIQGNTNPYRQLELGYKTADSANYGTIQAFEQNTGARPLVLQPAGGSVSINKLNPASALDVNGTVTATAFNPSSDRNLKEHLGAINPREILDRVASLAIWRWNFKADAATPHLGPMAQDFFAAFNVGSDDRHIATVDADGVALAAIQGLNQKLEAEKSALERQLEARDAVIQALQRRLEAIEKRLAP